MSEEKLRSLFRDQGDQHVSPTESCIADDQVVRLLESESPGVNHAKLKEHIADCPYCASRLAQVLRPSGVGANPAHRLVRHETAAGLRYLAIAAAASAVTISLFWLQPDNGFVSGDIFESRAVRQPQVVPSLTFPTEGQIVRSADMTVRWTAVADAMHYSVRIVDDYGRLIVDSFTDTAEYAVPSHIELAPGVDYYVKIDAYVVGDKAVSSSHTHFTVSD